MIKVDYNSIAGCIPEYLNALYNEDAFATTSLAEIRDAFRKKQIEGKTTLLSQVEKFCVKDSQLLVVGSWLGFTSFCLNKMGYKNITETDPDDRLEKLAIHANRFNHNFKHLSLDVNSIDTTSFDCIINSSCEHIIDNSWFNNSKQNTLFVLQSTDYPNWDHVNTCSSIEEMINKYPMTVLYADTLNLGTYNRFTLVGRK